MSSEASFFGSDLGETRLQKDKEKEKRDDSELDPTTHIDIDASHFSSALSLLFSFALFLPSFVLSFSSVQFLHVLGEISLLVFGISIFLNLSHVYHFPVAYLATLYCPLPVRKNLWFVNGVYAGIVYSYFIAYPCGIALAFVCTVKVYDVPPIPKEFVDIGCFCVAILMWLSLEMKGKIRKTVSDCFRLNGDAYDAASQLGIFFVLLVIAIRFGETFASWLGKIVY